MSRTAPRASISDTTGSSASIRSSWSADVDALFADTAGGDAHALGELLRRHGRPAVCVALRAVLDAGEEEAAVVRFLLSSVVPQPTGG
jgi:hypothetical protein